MLLIHILRFFYSKALSRCWIHRVRFVRQRSPKWCGHIFKRFRLTYSGSCCREMQRDRKCWSCKLRSWYYARIPNHTPHVWDMDVFYGTTRFMHVMKWITWCQLISSPWQRWSIRWKTRFVKRIIVKNRMNVTFVEWYCKFTDKYPFKKLTFVGYKLLVT